MPPTPSTGRPPSFPALFLAILVSKVWSPIARVLEDVGDHARPLFLHHEKNSANLRQALRIPFIEQVGNDTFEMSVRVSPREIHLFVPLQCSLALDFTPDYVLDFPRENFLENLDGWVAKENEMQRGNTTSRNGAARGIVL